MAVTGRAAVHITANMSSPSSESGSLHSSERIENLESLIKSKYAGGFNPAMGIPCFYMQS
jgi:hypothetical protein